jgi:hypothetical protein
MRELIRRLTAAAAVSAEKIRELIAEAVTLGDNTAATHIYYIVQKRQGNREGAGLGFAPS